MTRRGMGDRRHGVRTGIVAAALAGALTAGPAAAELCDMRLYLSSFGEQLGEPPNGVFPINAQFIVCFRARSDGYVSLWDRPPNENPVERLVPNANYTGTGQFGANVKGGETTCFGDGSAGYFLVMEKQDGAGLGLMWLVFTAEDRDHPGEETFGSADVFAGAWENGALGAGVVAVAEGRERPDPGRVPPGDDSACAWESSIEAAYRVGAP